MCILHITIDINYMNIVDKDMFIKGSNADQYMVVVFAQLALSLLIITQTYG